MSLYKRYIAVLLGLMFASAFIRCASVGAPQGGPKDSLPPMFLYSDPQPLAVNFNGKKATLNFNEYIQLKDQQKLFFMSPPAVKKPLLMVKGKSVEVEFQEPLDSNATYRLDFGSAIVDNNEGNKMDNFSIVFGTGPQIDTLIMAGQVLNAFTRDTVVGAFMFFFDQKADSMVLDSTMFKARAEALFRTDSSGYFVADILKDKNYKLYALADENSNQMYEAGTDMIGFLDSTVNPTLVEPFYMRYDELKKRWQMDSLTTMLEVFKEDPIKRQTLLESKRPMRNKITIAFSAQNTIIDTLNLEGIADSLLIKKWNATKDTISVWIAPNSEEDFKALADTIKARVAFQKQDSVFNFYSAGQDIYFTHKITLSDEELKKKEKEQQKIAQENRQKEREIKQKTKKSKKNKKGQLPIVDSTAMDSTLLPKIETADSVAQKTNVEGGEENKEEVEKVVNPFKVSVKASKDFVPVENMIFEFEYPLKSVDESMITLVNFPKVTKKGKLVQSDNPTAVEVPFTFQRDTANIVRYYLKTKWEEDIDYELTILPKTFTNIAFQSNDSLTSKFTVATQGKFGTIKIKTIKDAKYNGCFILQLIQKANKEDKIIKQMFVANDDQVIEIPYLSTGTYRLRVIKDANCNKKWDTGVLTKRVHPEMVRINVDQHGNDNLITKENWIIEVDVDYEKLFKM